METLRDKLFKEFEKTRWATASAIMNCEAEDDVSYSKKYADVAIEVFVSLLQSEEATEVAGAATHKRFAPQVYYDYDARKSNEAIAKEALKAVAEGLRASAERQNDLSAKNGEK